VKRIQNLVVLQFAQLGQVFPPNLASQLHVGELAVPPHFNQTGIDQFLEMVGQSRRSDWQLAPNIAAREFPTLGDS